LLQDLQHFRGISLRWFADEQMHMLGHDHISDQGKRAAQAQLIENPDKAIARADRSEVRASPVTAESDKVQVAASVEALERVTLRATLMGGKEKSKSAPLNPKGAAPKPSPAGV
jgi:hypothetical protein